MTVENALKRSSPWSPLRHPIFRRLWLAWLVATICMWMNELAAAWLMSTLTDDPALVALVRSAATLPAFILALPSGALADIVDRRRWFIATQAWISLVACTFALTMWLDAMSPPVLLALVLAFGTGLALRWPVYAAIVPDLVPREEVGQAVALNGVAANASRTIGPVVAGAVMTWLGVAWVFALNALLSVGSATVIRRWRPADRASLLPSERFIGAMRVGFQFAAHSPSLRSVLGHSFAFSLQTTALLALLPYIAKQLGGGEALYTILMATMSLGAIAAAAFMPRWRTLTTTQKLLQASATIYAASALSAVYANSVWLAVAAMVPAGATWMAASNLLSTSAQFALPDWVRARGMSL